MSELLEAKKTTIIFSSPEIGDCFFCLCYLSNALDVVAPFQAIIRTLAWNLRCFDEVGLFQAAAGQVDFFMSLPGLYEIEKVAPLEFQRLGCAWGALTQKAFSESEIQAMIEVKAELKKAQAQAESERSRANGLDKSFKDYRGKASKALPVAKND